MQAEKKQQELQDKRKRESRAMVQQILSAAQKQTDESATVDGIAGARNPMPDDKDDEDNNTQAQDEWEVRELERLLEVSGTEKARKEEEEELARRRNMTDEERLQEDQQQVARRQRQEQQRGDDDDKKFMQRYYHRGAFYMDESEWDETDVRHKAADYARAATGSDKIDKSALPEVMQVKKFGRANQNLRYKGLAAEDTTDKGMRTLPLVGSKRKPKKG